MVSIHGPITFATQRMLAAEQQLQRLHLLAFPHHGTGPERRAAYERACAEGQREIGLCAAYLQQARPANDGQAVAGA